jgi:glutamate dehydrogenase (NAD(P)+)
VRDLQQLFWNEKEVMERLEGLLNRAFDSVMSRAASEKVSHRMAALAIGIEKVRNAKATRGLFP